MTDLQTIEAATGAERVFCARFPQGWDDDEMRVEAFRLPGTSDGGRVVISTTTGASITIERYEIEDVARAMLSAKRELWAEYLRASGIPNKTAAGRVE